MMPLLGDIRHVQRANVDQGVVFIPNELTERIEWLASGSCSLKRFMMIEEVEEEGSNSTVPALHSHATLVTVY